MAVKSADRKPEKYIGPDGKPRIRMVPVDKEVVKSESANAAKAARDHMQGMQNARADMKSAKSADAMTKAMNKLHFHMKAHKKAMAAMSEAKDGDGVNIVKDRPFKGKPMKKEPDSGKGISFANMKKSKVAKDADANPNRSKAMGEAKEVDEISLKDLSNTISKSTGNKNLKKALKTDKLKADLAKMKMATEAKDPAKTVSQLAIRDTNRRFDRAKKSAEKDDENSKYRTSKSGNVFVGLKKEAKDPGEYDKEGDMAKTQLKTMIDAAQELHDQLSDDENMPEWVQNKITKATDYIDSVRDYMKNNDDVNEETQLDEYGGPPISRAKYLKQKPMKERELTPGEMKKREKYAQDLPDAEFKKRYGDRWKSVKIATATKMAKGEK